MFILGKFPQKFARPSYLLYFGCRFFSKPTNEILDPSNPIIAEPTSEFYDNLINVAGRSRDFTSIHNLLNKRVKDKCFNTTKTFRFITNEGDDLSVLDDLIQTVARVDEGFARKNAFDAVIARLCQLKHINKSLQVVDTMVKDGHTVINSCTFHPILSVLTRKKNMEEAIRILGLMKEMGVSPDVTCYNYLLTSYCIARDLTAAAGVLTKIKEEKLEPDSRTYDAMVLGACRAGRIEGALAMLRRMEDDGVSLMYSSHSHVISSLLKMGCYKQAVDFVLSYGGKDKQLDTESYGNLGSRLMRINRVEEAKLILGEMDKRGLVMGPKLRKRYTMLLSV